MTTEILKCYKISMLFDAQNAGNSISELLDFKFFWDGGMPPDPPSGHSHLLHLQWPLITNVIETLLLQQLNMAHDLKHFWS